MKRIYTLLFAVIMAVTVFAKAQRSTVVFDVDLHCQGCVEKIEKNIAFEKGVKDLRCDLKSRTVVVVYDPAKTNVAMLQDAFARLKKTATVNQLATDQANNPEKE